MRRQPRRNARVDREKRPAVVLNGQAAMTVGAPQYDSTVVFARARALRRFDFASVFYFVFIVCASHAEARAEGGRGRLWDGHPPTPMARPGASRASKPQSKLCRSKKAEGVW
jgi:hypothetical protein